MGHPYPPQRVLKYTPRAADGRTTEAANQNHQYTEEEAHPFLRILPAEDSSGHPRRVPRHRPVGRLQPRFSLRNLRSRRRYPGLHRRNCHPGGGNDRPAAHGASDLRGADEGRNSRRADPAGDFLDGDQEHHRLAMGAAAAAEGGFRRPMQGGFNHASDLMPRQTSQEKASFSSISLARGYPEFVFWQTPSMESDLKHALFFCQQQVYHVHQLSDCLSLGL